MRHALGVVAFALGALRRRRGKTLAVGIGLTLVTMGFASVVMLTDALRGEARREIAAMPEITVARLRGGRPGLVDARDAQAVSALEGQGVASVRGRVWGYLFYEALASNIAVVGVPSERVGVDVATVMEPGGRAPHPGERSWIVLGRGVLTLLGAEPGDGMGIASPGGSSVDLTILGAFRSASELTTADVALMDERDARTLMGLEPTQSTDLVVTLTNPEESAVVSRKIREALPDVRVIERRSLVRAYELTYGTRGGLVALAMLPALLALLVLAWDRATGLSPEERREVAVLKSVGWPTSDVIASRITESVLVAVASGVLGVVGAYTYVFGFRAPGLANALLGWSVLHPAFRLSPAPEGTSAAVLVALVAVPYVTAAIVPAWRAAQVDPGDALRG